MRDRLPFALALLTAPWAAAGAALEPAPAGGCRRAGPHFEVAADFDRPEVAARALAVAEAAYGRAAELFGRPDPEAEPLGIRLLRTAAEYRRVDRRLTGGHFASNLAFSSFRTRCAYIAVQPPCGDEELARVGLTALALHQVAHEAAHVVCYNALASYAYQPTWLAEGAASWVGEETLRDLGESPGLERDPYTAKWILLAQTLARENRLPKLHDVFEGRTQHLDLYERYAVWGLAFRYLATHESEPLARALERARGLPAEPALRSRLVRILRDELGPRYAGLDEGFRAWLAGLEPAWDETGRALETAGSDWVQSAFADQPARAWRLDEHARGLVLSGALELVSSGPGAAAEVLVRRGGRSPWVISFEATGRVRAAREGEGGLSAPALERRLAAGPVAGRRVPFRISAASHRLTVVVDGQVALEAELAAGESPVAWGLGVRPGTVAIWHGVAAGDPDG